MIANHRFGPLILYSVFSECRPETIVAGIIESRL